MRGGEFRVVQANGKLHKADAELRSKDSVLKTTEDHLNHLQSTFDAQTLRMQVVCECWQSGPSAMLSPLAQ